MQQNKVGLIINAPSNTNTHNRRTTYWNYKPIPNLTTAWMHNFKRNLSLFLSVVCKNYLKIDTSNWQLTINTKTKQINFL